MKTFYITILILNWLFALEASETNIVVIYTNNTNGILENCKCPEHAYGALEKRAYLIDSLRQVHTHVLLLDAGDIFDIRQDSLLHNHIIRAYAIIGYDYYVAGDQDFVEGANFFYKLMSLSNMTLLNSNISNQNKSLGKRYDIRKFDDIRIGITGTINERLYKYLDDGSKKIFTFGEQIPQLRSIISSLDSESDFIILLSHSGFENDRILAQNFPQIDLIVGGHSQTIVSEPVLEENTLIAQAGESGYRVGILHLNFKQKKLDSYKNELYLLDITVPDDPRILEVIDQYHRNRLNRLGSKLIKQQ